MSIADTESLGAPGQPPNRNGGAAVRSTAGFSGSNYWLYLMTDGDAVKVGISDVPPKRAKQLQTGNPDRLEILATAGFPDKTAAKKVEDEWKRRWKQWATNGGSEWFRPPSEQVSAAIKEILASSQLPPEEPEPGIMKVLDESIRAGFSASDKATNAICKMMRLPSESKPQIRGLLIEAFFKAGDDKQDSLRRHIPEIDAIISSQLETAKRQFETSPKPEIVAMREKLKPLNAG